MASTPQFFSDNQARITGFDADADLDLNVHFDDGVFIDKDKQRADEMALVTAGIMPKKEYLIRNFGLSETDADKWLQEVKDEQPDFTSGSYEQGSPNDDQGADE